MKVTCPQDTGAFLTVAEIHLIALEPMHVTEKLTIRGVVSPRETFLSLPFAYD
jgi:hypothetical protein